MPRGAHWGHRQTWRCAESRAMACQKVSDGQGVKGPLLNQTSARGVGDGSWKTPGQGQPPPPQLPKASLGADGIGRALNRPGLGLGTELRAGCGVLSPGPSLPASVPTSAFSVLESQAQGGRRASRQGCGGQQARSLEGLPLKRLVQQAEAVGGGRATKTPNSLFMSQQQRLQFKC